MAIGTMRCRWTRRGIAVAVALAASALPSEAARAAGDTPRRPDLVVASISDPPHRAGPGDRFVARDVTRNAGRRRAAASATHYALGAQGPLAIRAVPALRKRAASSGDVEITVPASIPDGEYRLVACADAGARVRERDEGNNCRSSAGALVVDTTPPAAPTIDEHPAAVTMGGDAHIAFSGREADLSFACALDGAPPTDCANPVELTGLADGEHAFRVVARDAAGNESPPTEVRWTAIPEQMTLGDGAWSWFADPRAVHHQGAHRRTYVGWVAQDGDVKISAYDHDTLIKTTAVIAPRVEPDDHANPAIQVLPDGRLRAFYSRHSGATMWSRTSLAPEEISAWGPAVTMPENSTGSRGFTYPNPIRLAAEGRTYLFWRGGDYNPTFASQADGSSTWSPVRRLISAPGRPYVKYDTDGEATIHFAFTNAHPAESGDVNIYYAAYRDGAVRRADGTPIGTLGTAITPAQADVVFDEADDAWIHDVAHDAQGRPVIVFAAFASSTDHRYYYARWTGERWSTPRLITPAGGTISEDPREPWYSGGITLDHEDPRTLYLSRQVGKAWEIETWSTPDGGDSWEVEAVTAGSDTKNVRPVSPRGMLPFSGDLSVLWMRGRYPYYLTYQTSIATILRTGGNVPPLADASLTRHAGLAPQVIGFDGRPSQDQDGTIVDHRWDFGDGVTATGAEATHVYERPGRYFATLTVTDDAGARATSVTEVVIHPAVVPGPALDVADDSATLHGTVVPRDEATTYHFEYGTDGLDARTPDRSLAAGGSAAVDVEAAVSGLIPGLTYRYRLVATVAAGTTAGPERTFTAGVPSGPGDYRDVVLGTPGLLAYWRLGEPSGSVAVDELGSRPGGYTGTGVTLGQAGALRGDPDAAAAFDGTAGEMTAATDPLTTAGTLEGWFHWQAGVAVMRDNTAMSGTGWILAYETGGMIACRAGGTALVSSTPIASVRDGWHHLALTRDRDDVRLYLDGRRLALPATPPGPATSAAPWHVMRNGTATSQYARGRADEVAVYDRPLTAADVRQRVALGPGGTG